MLSQTAEYALRAVVILAGHQEPQTTQQIASAGKTPLDYLSKVLQQLARARLVTAVRGKGGGFRLARSPQAVTLLEVVNAVDPIRRIRSCPLQLAAHVDALCPLHRKLDDAVASVERALATTCVADLLEEPAICSPKEFVAHA